MYAMCAKSDTEGVLWTQKDVFVPSVISFFAYVRLFTFLRTPPKCMSARREKYFLQAVLLEGSVAKLSQMAGSLADWPARRLSAEAYVRLHASGQTSACRLSTCYPTPLFHVYVTLGTRFQERFPPASQPGCRLYGELCKRG